MNTRERLAEILRSHVPTGAGDYDWWAAKVADALAEHVVLRDDLEPLVWWDENGEEHQLGADQPVYRLRSEKEGE